jgi:hypothetical protein
MFVSINSNYDNVKLQNVSVTLTFEVGACILDTTHCLHVVDIGATLFQNPLMYDKVTVWTQMKWGRIDRQIDGAVLICLPLGA